MARTGIKGLTFDGVFGARDDNMLTVPTALDGFIRTYSVLAHIALTKARLAHIRIH
jgi:hypothetical protein